MPLFCVRLSFACFFFFFFCYCCFLFFFFFFSSRRRHTRFDCDWSSDVCSSDLGSSWSRSGAVRAVLGWVLRRAEAAIPPSHDVAGYLREQQADALVMTPLIGVVGSAQPDYLRAARAARLPVAVAVWSWDHLTSKALIREAPDRVMVWNDVQRGEAERLHGIAADRVVVTGAQCFDQWFGRRPSRSRAEFCAAVGLPGDKPFLLYVGSALFAGSPPEAGFVQRWIAAIRASADPVLRDCGILVRPHPQRL